LSQANQRLMGVMRLGRLFTFTICTVKQFSL